MLENPTDSEKIKRVDRWLDDVSSASQRWKSAKSAQQSVMRVVEYLEEIKARVHGAPPDLRERMDEAIAKNRANAEALAEAALRQSELESGFYETLGGVRPPEVAEAWRMRCMEHKTWLQCSMALHYNRTHLERLSRQAKLAAYDTMPREYR